MSVHNGDLLPQKNVSDDWQRSEYSGKNVLIVNWFQRKVVHLQKEKTNAKNTETN